MAQEDHSAGGGPQDHHLIGPTTAETEEFYAYQRQHPGMTKNELADWFMDKYKKAVELRRRRSDQPSDLEYMVIKKRAKYRERIPEGEMTELLKYATHNPDASYRQIADHFQNNWNRSIDPNTVQRLLKRRGEKADGDGSSSANGDSGVQPPPSKRRRRSGGGPPLSSSTPGSVSSTLHGQNHHHHHHHHHQLRVQSLPQIPYQPPPQVGPRHFSTSHPAASRTPTSNPNLTPRHSPKNRAASIVAASEDNQNHHPRSSPTAGSLQSHFQPMYQTATHNYPPLLPYPPNNGSNGGGPPSPDLPLRSRWSTVERQNPANYPRASIAVSPHQRPIPLPAPPDSRSTPESYPPLPPIQYSQPPRLAPYPPPSTSSSSSLPTLNQPPPPVSTSPAILAPSQDQSPPTPTDPLHTLQHLLSQTHQTLTQLTHTQHTQHATIAGLERERDELRLQIRECEEMVKERDGDIAKLKRGNLELQGYRERYAEAVREVEEVGMKVRSLEAQAGERERRIARLQCSGGGADSSVGPRVDDQSNGTGNTSDSDHHRRTEKDTPSERASISTSPTAERWVDSIFRENEIRDMEQRHDNNLLALIDNVERAPMARFLDALEEVKSYVRGLESERRDLRERWEKRAEMQRGREREREKREKKDGGMAENGEKEGEGEGDGRGRRATAARTEMKASTTTTERERGKKETTVSGTDTETDT